MSRTWLGKIALAWTSILLIKSDYLGERHIPKINIDDIDLFYVIYDQKKVVDKVDNSKPIMIFLHGGPGMVDHTIYIPFWMQLSEWLPVIFVDQRGNGCSEHGNPKLWNLTQYGQDVKRLCDALGIKKPTIAGSTYMFNTKLHR